MGTKRINYYLKGFFDSFHLRLRLANLVCNLLPDFFSGVIRGRVYRLIGFKIGPETFIMSNLELLTGQSGIYQKLEIGRNVLISSKVTINLDAKVIIEDHVTLAPFVRIYTGTHRIGPAQHRCQNMYSRPVVIESGSWIALGATILPGVRVGRGSVVAAGSVVTTDIPPNSFVAGVPARILKTLPETGVDKQ